MKRALGRGESGRHNLRFALNVAIVDRDLHRRTAVEDFLDASAVLVEAFESIEELSLDWPLSGVILIHDEGAAITTLMDRMARAGEWLPVIAFSEDPSAAQIVQAIMEGAIEYVEWPNRGDEFLEALDHALGRAERIGEARQRKFAAHGRIETLTRREREVLTGVTNGLSNRQIGEELEISPRTVEVHRARMLKKLGASHTSDAVRVAIEAELSGRDGSALQQ